MKAAVLPVPGLGGGEDVLAGEDEGDGAFLDGGGLGVALLRDGPEEVGRQAEGIEGHLAPGLARAKGARGEHAGRLPLASLDVVQTTRCERGSSRA